MSDRKEVMIQQKCCKSSIIDDMLMEGKLNAIDFLNMYKEGEKKMKQSIPSSNEDRPKKKKKNRTRNRRPIDYYVKMKTLLDFNDNVNGTKSDYVNQNIPEMTSMSMMNNCKNNRRHLSKIQNTNHRTITSQQQQQQGQKYHQLGSFNLNDDIVSIPVNNNNNNNNNNNSFTRSLIHQPSQTMDHNLNNISSSYIAPPPWYVDDQSSMISSMTSVDGLPSYPMDNSVMFESGISLSGSSMTNSTCNTSNNSSSYSLIDQAQKYIPPPTSSLTTTTTTTTTNNNNNNNNKLKKTKQNNFHSRLNHKNHDNNNRKKLGNLNNNNNNNDLMTKSTMVPSSQQNGEQAPLNWIKDESIINRIIRNEKVKLIRQRVNELENLKQYELGRNRKEQPSKSSRLSESTSDSSIDSYLQSTQPLKNDSNIYSYEKKYITQQLTKQMLSANNGNESSTSTSSNNYEKNEKANRRITKFTHYTPHDTISEHQKELLKYQHLYRSNQLYTDEQLCQDLDRLDFNTDFLEKLDNIENDIQDMWDNTFSEAVNFLQKHHTRRRSSVCSDSISSLSFFDGEFSFDDNESTQSFITTDKSDDNKEDNSTEMTLYER
ncbi:hypothetical protein SNEBB_010930 [Seison nebaliae]|nr:hypothetical protein SNEBB_010930 [Seison nebaliae]